MSEGRKRPKIARLRGAIAPRGTLLSNDASTVPALLPAFVDAGFEAMNLSRADDGIATFRHTTTGLALHFSDQGGSRLMLTCYLGIGEEQPVDARETFAKNLNANLWGKFMIDPDGDLQITHVIVRCSALYQPQLMQTIHAFAGLCTYVRDTCDVDKLLTSSKRRKPRPSDGKSIEGFDPGDWMNGLES